MVLSHMFNAFSNLITATSFSSSPFTGSVTTRAAFSGCAFLCGTASLIQSWLLHFLLQLSRVPLQQQLSQAPLQQ
jgi:hypothetical protein